LSEEAQECQNKNYKNYREHHTRKLSRVKINEDLINMLLVSSDPLISSMRKIQPKKLQTFSDGAKLLIIMPEDQARDSSNSESDNDSEQYNFFNINHLSLIFLVKIVLLIIILYIII